jgi:hypothetical protein
MKCHRYLVIAAIGCAGVAAAAADRPGDAFFSTARVAPLHITLSPDALATLTPGPPGSAPAPAPTAAHRNTFGIELPWNHGDLEVDGKRFADVGVRCKGNYTFLASTRSLRKSLKIDFNRHVDGQALDGLTMLNLHCGISDRSRAREALSYAFFRAAGVPAPRTTFAELSLTVPGRYDREFVGLFTVTEQVDKRFLERHFGSGAGMLLKPEGLHGGPAWLGEEWEPYAARYRPEKEPTKRARRRLVEFTRLVSQADDEHFAATIDRFLDVDAFLRFIAANALLANLDSYLGYGHNYYLHLVPETDRFAFIPWDLDLSLATWPAAGTPEQLVRLSLDHPHAGDDTLLDRLLAIPARRERYRAILAELVAGPFARDRLHAERDAIEGATGESLALESVAVVLRGEGAGPMGSGRFGDALPPRAFIEKRADSVAAQLSGRETGFVPRPVMVGRR